MSGPPGAVPSPRGAARGRQLVNWQVGAFMIAVVALGVLVQASGSDTRGALALISVQAPARCMMLAVE